MIWVLTLCTLTYVLKMKLGFMQWFLALVACCNHLENLKKYWRLRPNPRDFHVIRLKSLMPRLQPQPIKSEPLGMGPGHQHFWSSQMIPTYSQDWEAQFKRKKGVYLFWFIWKWDSELLANINLIPWQGFLPQLSVLGKVICKEPSPTYQNRANCPGMSGSINLINKDFWDDFHSQVHNNPR